MPNNCKVKQAVFYFKVLDVMKCYPFQVKLWFKFKIWLPHFTDLAWHSQNLSRIIEPARVRQVFAEFDSWLHDSCKSCRTLQGRFARLPHLNNICD